MYDYNYLNKFADKESIIWCDELIKIYKYPEVLSESQKVSALFEKYFSNSEVQLNIAVQCEHLPSMISILISILNQSHFIQCLELEGLPIITEFNFLLSTKLYTFPTGELLDSIRFYDEVLVYLYMSKAETTVNNNQKIEIQEDTSLSNLICYCVKTSGSTGEPKRIRVPYKCIVPNIIHLSNLFNITSDDVLLVSAPPTFDDFFVDIFLALKNGATLFATSERIKLTRLQLLELISPNNEKYSHRAVTFMQLTPSVFKQWPLPIISDRLFSKKSALRTLVLGGEEIPSITEITKWQNWNDTEIKQIFNIYGISEVSCWSSIYEITAEILNSTAIPLGSSIDNETILEIRNSSGDKSHSGELFIGSKTRKCLINDEAFSILSNENILFIGTGDYVEERNGNIYYLGRTNNIVKHYGIRTDLNKIERKIQNTFPITNGCCIHNRAYNQLLFFYTSNEGIELATFFEASQRELQPHERPDDFIQITEFPLTNHGKICKRQLLNRYRRREPGLKRADQANCLIDSFLEELHAKFGFDILGEDTESTTKRIKLDMQLSFTQLGGTSIKAMEILTSLETLMNTPLPNLIIILLDGTKSIQDAINYLENCTPSREILIKPETIQKDPTKITIALKFKYDLTKCIDSSPTVQNNIVSVGSHSHIFVNLRVETGELVSRFELPDRIECQMVSLTDVRGLIGCYNGYLYNFDLHTGEIIWEFNSQGMIKCRPLVIDEELIVFGNYSDDDNLWCINKYGIKMWSQRVGTKGILAAPLLLKENLILICTLNGLCVAINTFGIVKWSLKYETPIFSSPQIIPITDIVLIAEVNGVVHAVEDGTEIATYKCAGNIFSSFAISENSEIYFGCYDHHLYCLQLEQSEFKVKWKSKLQSQIYSTPALLFDNKINNNKKRIVVACSTNGSINFISCNGGNIINTFELAGEIYSAPALVNDKSLLIGCRDNFLYCLDLHIYE